MIFDWNVCNGHESPLFLFPNACGKLLRECTSARIAFSERIPKLSQQDKHATARSLKVQLNKDL